MIGKRIIADGCNAVRIHSTHRLVSHDENNIIVGICRDGVAIHVFDNSEDLHATGLFSFSDVRELIAELQALLPPVEAC